MTTAREILIKGLQAMGADGLVNGEIECGCGIDDLAPCCACLDGLTECRAAVRDRGDGQYYQMEDQ